MVVAVVVADDPHVRRSRTGTLRQGITPLVPVVATATALGHTRQRCRWNRVRRRQLETAQGFVARGKSWLDD